MFYLPILNSKCDKDDGASDMNFFRYADDYYNGWAAEQLLLPTAILFSIGVVLFIGIHLLRRSAGQPVATEERGSFSPGDVQRYELGARLYHWGNLLFLAGLAVSGVTLFVPGDLKRTVLSWLRIHELFAALFIAGVVLHIVVAPRRGERRTMWFERRDWSDLKLIWANFLGKSRHYAFGKYDPAQKLYHAYITLATSLVIFTGGSQAGGGFSK